MHGLMILISTSLHTHIYGYPKRERSVRNVRDLWLRPGGGGGGGEGRQCLMSRLKCRFWSVRPPLTLLWFSLS